MPNRPPIDIEPPNQHASKSDFLFERDAVLQSIDHANSLLDHMVGKRNEPDHEQSMRHGLRDRLDEFCRKRIGANEVDTPYKLVAESAKLSGFGVSLGFMLLEYIEALKARRKELEDQEKEFWTVTSRPPNYHARTIALRTARVYARTLRKFPTVGTSRDGGHPNTEYTRALEQIFKIIGIKARVRKPAEWAISQLTEEDLGSQENALGSLFRSSQQLARSQGVLGVVDALTARTQKGPSE